MLRIRICVLGFITLLLLASYKYPTIILAADSGPDTPGLPELKNLLLRIIYLSVGLALIAFVFITILGGIRYLTSSGDPNAVKTANQTLTWGVLGIIFLILAWISLRLVAAFTGVDVTKFCLGFQPYCIL